MKVHDGLRLPMPEVVAVKGRHERAGYLAPEQVEDASRCRGPTPMHPRHKNYSLVHLGNPTLYFFVDGKLQRLRLYWQGAVHRNPAARARDIAAAGKCGQHHRRNDPQLRFIEAEVAKRFPVGNVMPDQMIGEYPQDKVDVQRSVGTSQEASLLNVRPHLDRVGAIDGHEIVGRAEQAAEGRRAGDPVAMAVEDQPNVRFPCLLKLASVEVGPLGHGEGYELNSRVRQDLEMRGSMRPLRYTSVMNH